MLQGCVYSVETPLTKKAHKVMFVLYKEYKRRIKNGSSVHDALDMTDDEWVHDNLLREWPLEDITISCFELSKHDLVTAIPADDHVYYLAIAPAGIAFAEGRWKRRFNVFSKVRDLLPF